MTNYEVSLRLLYLYREARLYYNLFTRQVTIGTPTYVRNFDYYLFRKLYSLDALNFIRGDSSIAIYSLSKNYYHEAERLYNQLNMFNTPELYNYVKTGFLKSV